MNKRNKGFIQKKYFVLVNAVVLKKDKVLICQRSWEEKHGPGKWTIPGGKLEYTNETFGALEKTAQREVLEETGLRVKEEMCLVANNTFCHNEDNLSVIAIVFLCYYDSGKAKPLEDTIDTRWVGIEEIESFDFHTDNVKGYINQAFKLIK